MNPPTEQELPSKLKSILASAIIKGLDIIGIVSKYGFEVGKRASQIATENNFDIKVISGQDYQSSEGIKAVFFNLSQNVQQNLPIQEAIKIAKSQKGKVMLYDLSKSVAKEISSWQSTPYEPDLVEIYNAHSKAYKDLDIDYPRVISSASRSGSELENTPVCNEISRKRLESIGILDDIEGVDFTPGYLREKNNA